MDNKVSCQQNVFKARRYSTGMRGIILINKIPLKLTPKMLHFNWHKPPKASGSSNKFHATNLFLRNLCFEEFIQVLYCSIIPKGFVLRETLFFLGFQHSFYHQFTGWNSGNQNVAYHSDFQLQIRIIHLCRCNIYFYRSFISVEWQLFFNWKS